MNSLSIIKMTIGFVWIFGNISFAYAARECSIYKMIELISRSTEDNQIVYLDCNLRLPTNKYNITKKIIIQGSGASGMTLDCNNSRITFTNYTKNDIGDALVIRSTGSWLSKSRPENVTIKNCKIDGSVRVYGLGVNGESRYVKESSQLDNLHTTRAQLAAPRNTLFDNVVINTIVGRIPLYISPGVTYTKLINSEIKGSTEGVGIYLDTESAFNTIHNNHIHVNSSRREQIAVDGSANNLISNNLFSGLNTGGIYLYRNCGEGGTIRIQEPRYNQIINNRFYYVSYNGGNKAIHIGSRQGNRNYCDHDVVGKFYGSAISNRDHANYNIVAENQFLNRNPNDFIQNSDTDNLIIYNQNVSQFIDRPLGCGPVVARSKILHYVKHNDYFAYDYNINADWGYRFYCSDHRYTRVELSSLVTRADYCAREGSNSGCTRLISCPSGKKILRAKAGCNLETTSLSVASLQNNVDQNTVRALRSSTNLSEGYCRFGSSSTTYYPRSILSDIGAFRSAYITCREYDANGGDCIIRSELKCI